MEELRAAEQAAEDAKAEQLEFEAELEARDRARRSAKGQTTSCFAAERAAVLAAEVARSLGDVRQLLL